MRNLRENDINNWPDKEFKVTAIGYSLDLRKEWKGGSYCRDKFVKKKKKKVRNESWGPWVDPLVKCLTLDWVTISGS